jgi:hypothetical protein
VHLEAPQLGVEKLLTPEAIRAYHAYTSACLTAALWSRMLVASCFLSSVSQSLTSLSQFSVN